MSLTQISLFEGQEESIYSNSDIESINKNELNYVSEDLVTETIIEEPEVEYFTSAYDICKTEYPDESMLIEDLLPTGVISVCVASSDVGKSMFWRQACACIAMQRDSFIGKKLNIKYGRAAYVSTEDNERVFNTQYNAWNLSDEELSLLKNLHVKVETKKFPNKEFFIQAKRKPYDLIVVDVLSDVIQDDLNDARKTRDFYNQFKPLINEFGTSILFIHHINKAGDRLGSFSKNHVLGSSAIESASRSLIFITKENGEDSVRKISLLKCNNLSDAKKNKPFKVRFTERLWFEDLSPNEHQPLSTARLEQDLSKQVLYLHDRGHSQRTISKLLTERGFTIGKTKVGDILKRESIQDIE